MKISEFWLRESVDLTNISRSQLLDKLTAAGLEVEGCEDVAPAFSGVVVGAIIACEKHPDADKLRVCQVDIGASETLQIVCGAPNARLGLKAPLALVGSTLPGGLTIKVGKLRGVDSFGMLCSRTELGLPTAGVDGLFELPADAPLGISIREYLTLDDAIIELKMTPNRSDCLGVQGLARELCALFNRKATPNVSSAIAPSISDQIDITLSDPAACPRYLGQVVRGIDTQALTPLWLQERLRRSGIRCVHPVVDITNYVLLEFGQPMHAFDLGAVNGGITVRRAIQGETLKMLDEQTANLDARFLVISDREKALAVAGVMGGFESRVLAESVDIFFEAAHFAPEVIMGRARLLGLHTDASHRFERGVDASLPEAALARATSLLVAICGGQVGPVCRSENLAHLPKQCAVNLRRAKLDEVLGVKVSDAQVESILGDLGFAVLANSHTENGWQVTPHAARFDISIEADLIEEIARVYGYDLIPVRLPSLSLTPLAAPESVRPLAHLRHVLAARDYQEAISFAFTSSIGLAAFGFTGHAIKNPLSADIDVMRPSLLPNLLNAVGQNQRRQLDRVRLFETGVVFLDAGTHEPGRIAGVAVGAHVSEQWATSTRAVDFFDVKGDVDALLNGTQTAHYAPFSAGSAPGYLHPGRSAKIYFGEKPIGVIGQLHPGLIKALDLRGEPIVFELELDAVCARQIPKAQALCKFPSSRRDLAFVFNDAVPFEAVKSCARAAGGETLLAIDCFDVYRGAGLAEGHKSLAISLILQDFSRTLSDQEVDASVQRVITAIRADLGGVIRS
jgi:phenylalanyl-tRNA synthetase beta chain